MRRLILLTFIGCVAGSPFLFAEEKKEEEANFGYNTVTTREGLTFRVPEDMPIESRGGIQAPIPFDEYMYGKFKQMEDRLKSIQEQLDRVEKALSDPAASKKKRSVVLTSQ